MRRQFVKCVLLTFAAVFALATAGCNTMKGVGEDMESAGEAIQDAAD
jgi:predicted small secreted protein